MNEQLLKREEQAVFALRALYARYGYRPFKMSKFEEYDFYARNKEFLVSDRIITFTDTDGRLLALKPDVTLSIARNLRDEETADCGCKQKVYYNENVYRVSGGTRQYKEILQTGLECMGALDRYDLFEVVSLAAQSLAAISDSFLLEVSHLGVLTALLEESGGEEAFCREATRCVAGKNAHDLRSICGQYGIPAEQTDKLCAFVGINGERKRVLAQLETLCGDSAGEALSELRALSELLDRSPYGERILFDFSVVNDGKYYNGIVFKGFLDGICEGVLSGGQYDKLMRRLGKRSGAAGFALYLDLLEDLQPQSREYDVDVLLLYNEQTEPQALANVVQELTAAGKSVSAQKSVPPKLRSREVVHLEVLS
ncbi:MAG: ATP phosphoribosyltransferase regulatory subunit [Oscillospiraceae bacterium]|nr:ATP phosphoribosyltransferase regulatory subunit [Oscillospiraceae bacterium]